MKIQKYFFVFVLAVQIVACSSQQTASAPKSEKYVSQDLYPAAKLLIPDFPAKGSADQKADEAELRKQQKARTAKDCERAQSEVVVNLQTFYRPPY